MVVCPSAVIEVWFSEIRKYFPSLKSFRWYEVAEKQRMAHIRDATLPPKATDFKKWLQEKCPPDRPRSAKTVIITSYETLNHRGLVITPSTTGKSTYADYSLRGRCLSRPSPLPLVADGYVANFVFVAEALWVGEHDEPEGVLIDISNEYSTILAGLFHRVVLDEGTKVKNPQTLAANMIMLLKAPNKWVLSATPMMNRAIDYLGYLYLLWDEAMMLDDEEDYDEIKTLYVDDSWVPTSTAAYKRGGMYDFQKYRLRLWRLNPHMFKQVMAERQVDLTALMAYEVLRSITQLITLRRTQATVLDVNGESVRIGSRIPIYRICTVEVDHENEHAFLEYQRRFNQLTKKLGTKLAKTGKPRRFMAPKADGPASIGQNFGIHRLLSLMTLDKGLDKLARRISRSLVGDVERWYHMNRDHGMSLYFRATRPERNMPSYPDRFSFGLYLSKDSPKIQYMMGLLGKICRGDDPQRALIYCDLPMPHWSIEGNLKVSPFRL